LFVEFINDFADEMALQSLNHYIKTASVIRADEGFEGSRVSKLEMYILKISECLREFDYIPALNAFSAFFAIAAPSMEGKTQSAFVFEDLKPLYFSFNSEQSIYRNFSSLSHTLEKAAQIDILKIISISPGVDFNNVSALNEDFSHVKFYVLGFLVALVKDARANCSSKKCWMQYHSMRSNFEFLPVSHDDLRLLNFNFSGFCLFLDEFSNSNWSVYVRNLARKVGLRCVVANTNSKIAGNLWDRSGGSGADSVPVWSFVVTFFDRMSLFVVDSLYNLSGNIATLSALPMIDNGLRVFLNDNLITQVLKLRPGAAIFVTESLREFIEEARESTQIIDLKYFLNYICRSFASKLIVRKPCFRGELETMHGNIGILFPGSYVKIQFDSSDNPYFNSPKFLDFHLFYLQNMQKVNQWMFTTLAPFNTKRNQSLKIPMNGIVTYTWTTEYTYFDDSELFTILGCMFVPFSRPIASLLKEAQSNHPEANYSHSNILEVSAFASVVDSSQHSYEDYSEYSFGGQSGTTFINNLIVNLIEDAGYLKQSTKIVRYPREVFDLKAQFLDLCKIPFLYSVNREDATMESISSSNPSFFVSSFKRTSNDEEIDGHFDFKFNNGTTTDTSFRACIECKNYNERIGTSLLTKILKKCINSRLSLVFCRSFATKCTSKSQFIQLCQRLGINIYRVLLAASGGFNVVPLIESYPITPTPTLICILLEADRINGR
jgi:hypothetical protein